MKDFWELISAHFIDVLQLIILLLFVLLRAFNQVDSSLLMFVSIIIVGSLVVRNIVSLYLNYILKVRDSQYFPDNRSVNFLTFDGLKFVLILISLVAVIVLGLNKVLNNETIATLLGGLIGSLLSMRGSYTDLNPKDFQQDTGTPK